MPLLFLPLVVVGEGWQEEVAMDGEEHMDEGMEEDLEQQCMSLCMTALIIATLEICHWQSP